MQVTVEDIGFRDKLNQLAARGLEAGRVLRVEGRRVLQEVMRHTYPESRQQGENKVRGDLAKVFLPVGPESVTMGRRSQKKSAADYVPLWTVKTGKLYATAHANFKPDASESEMSAIHKSKRNSRGSVRNFAPKLAAATPKRTMVNRIVVRRTTFNRYQRAVLTHVGKLRAGWAKGLQACGVTPPNWILRNATPDAGYVIDKLGKGDAPSLTVANTSAGAASMLHGFLTRALNARRMAIGENLKRMLKHGPGASGDYGYAKE
ncbi:MAG: hypothetical protein EB141_13345 [Verrucomicrobia bacterium]|nr:hypothetical protein [Verrucomicrobiota bacterium]NBU11421.1 hypothetical protein [Pseudomonadota bacterium]NDA68761.1 hypothetical protein [Verrucomicrobiota bacterium]NDB76604.1 hypothetical protein [Verrucomicrobiota bacterium]NDD39906.1 hypothetical protein [Verrucomicrobiota bacterium]